MATVDQPTPNPTNKLTAATLAGAAMALLGLVLKNEAPLWYDETALLALSPLAVFVAGYLVRDHATSTVVVVDKDGVQ